MSFLLRATRFVGRYLRSLQGLKYFSSAVQPQERFLTAKFTATAHSEPAAATSRTTFELPKGFEARILRHPEYIEKALKPLVDIIEQDSDVPFYMSLDAEWNFRRSVGVSILQICPHIDPLVVYVIAVHKLEQLPPSLLRLLTSERVWKVGSKIKGDLTRLRKQFPPQLPDDIRFSTIDLKAYALSKGIIQRKQSGSLAALCETVLGMTLPKDPNTRVHNNWEYDTISKTLLHYAACDVYASRRIFEAMSENDDAGGVQVLVAASDVEISVQRLDL